MGDDGINALNEMVMCCGHVTESQSACFRVNEELEAYIAGKSKGLEKSPGGNSGSTIESEDLSVSKTRNHTDKGVRSRHD